MGAVLSSALSGPLSRVAPPGRRDGRGDRGVGPVIALFGLIHQLWLGLTLLAVAGAADNVSAVLRQTVLQAATPDEYRGRLQGIFTVVVAGGPRLGDVESGGVAALTSEAFSVVSGGLACIAVVGVLVALMPQFLRYDARHPTP